MLRHFVASNQRDWCQYLDLVMLAYWTSAHSSTGHTPFELEHGRQARLTTHLIPEESGNYTTESEFIGNVNEKLRSAYDSARETNHKASLTEKKHHDRMVNPSNLEVGEEVYLLRPSSQLGLTPEPQQNTRDLSYTFWSWEKMIDWTSAFQLWKAHLGSPEPFEASHTEGGPRVQLGGNQRIRCCYGIGRARGDWRWSWGKKGIRWRPSTEPSL